MKARDLDARFDRGEDVRAEVDWSNASRPNVAIKRGNVDFPVWVIERLDQESLRLGVTRQSLIKLWIADRLR